MNTAEFNIVVEDTIDSIKKLLIMKGGEYANSTDRLANFKRGAANSGVTPLQVLHIYLSKHFDAFSTFVKDMAAGDSRELSEPIEGRLDDLINYCLLAKGLIKEERERGKDTAVLKGVERQSPSNAPNGLVPLGAGRTATEVAIGHGNVSQHNGGVWDSSPHTGAGVPVLRHRGDDADATGAYVDIHRR